MTRLSKAILIVLVAAPLCVAEIVEWGGRDPNTYSVEDELDITIRASGTFKFQSVTGGSPAAIGLIRVDDSVTGTVTLHIERDPNEVDDVPGLPGATNVGSIDLINNHMTPTIGNLAFMNITGALGGSAVSEVSAVTGTLILGNGGLSDGLARSLNASASGVGGNITVDGNLSSIATLNVGSMSGNLLIKFMSGQLTATSLSGNITFGPATSVGGTVTITNTYGGTIFASDTTSTTFNFLDDFTGELEIDDLFSGRIHINGDLGGRLTFAGVADNDWFSGEIDIAGGITADGRIVFEQDFREPGQVIVAQAVARHDPSNPPYEIPAIWAQRSILSGAASTTAPAIQINGALEGVIAVNGNVQNTNTNGDPNLAAEIQVSSIGTYGAIAVDYDGYQGQGLVDGAVIRVNTTNFSANSAANKVYVITKCLGDMNNDGGVDNDDGTTSSGPYDDARDSVATYVAAFPGLGGSREYHGNCDQRGAFDSDDDNEFASLVSGNCCTPKEAIGDADIDFDVDLDDLLLVLGNFGDMRSTPTGGTGSRRTTGRPRCSGW